MRTVRIWSEEAAVGGDGGQDYPALTLTWRSSPGPCAQPDPAIVGGANTGSEHLQPGEDSTAEALLVPQKTEAGRFVPGTHVL